MEEKNNYNVAFHHHHPYVCLFYEDAYVPPIPVNLAGYMEIRRTTVPHVSVCACCLKDMVFMYMTQKPISKPGHTYQFAALHYVTRTEDTLGTQ